jgi:hypothetical protein
LSQATTTQTMLKIVTTNPIAGLRSWSAAPHGGC